MSWAEEVIVTNRTELVKACSEAEPGAVIRLAPGYYAGGVTLVGLHGTAEAPIVLMAQFPEQRPVFRGATNGLHLSMCAHVHLKHLCVKGARGNGINIDDGGQVESPTHHIVLEDLVVLETGPEGNRDGIKLSGLVDFAVRKCRVVGWGGSAIDMVGCHNGIVESCHFEGRDGFSKSNAVQMKGGSRDLLIRGNVFRDAGHRSINIGGHTGLEYFRPSVGHYEATGIEVTGNQFFGSTAPIAWATSQGGVVHHNTFLYPEKWVLRILQENQGEAFAPTSGGVFESNIVVYDRRVSVAVNVGPGTDPTSFQFANNAWLTQGNRRPRLPVDEDRGEYVVGFDESDLKTFLAGQAKLGRGAASSLKQRTN